MLFPLGRSLESSALAASNLAFLAVFFSLSLAASIFPFFGELLSSDGSILTFLAVLAGRALELEASAFSSPDSSLTSVSYFSALTSALTAAAFFGAFAAAFFEDAFPAAFFGEAFSEAFLGVSLHGFLILL